MTCDYLAQRFRRRPTSTLILGHLSEHNNHPEIVRMGAAEALERRGLPRVWSIAEQNQPTEVFTF